MKLFTAAILASALALQSLSLPATGDENQASPLQRRTCGFATVPLYRLVNPSTGVKDHFYTTNTTQVSNAIASHSYVLQGITASVLPPTPASAAAPLAVPLYRLYSSAVKDHFYTTDAAERADAVARLGYKAEGITAYVYPAAGDCGAVPFYRMYNPKLADHFYTASEAQRENAIDNRGYFDEGVVAYVNPTQ